MQHFAVITGDIINSKKYPDNMEKLKEKLYQIPSSGLCTQFHISRGDELQGVCDNLSLLPGIIRNLRYVCRPLNVRLGIGIGMISDSSLGQPNSWDMNGQAFILARRALDSIKKSKIPQTVLVSDDSLFDRVFNLVYSLVDTVVNGWTHNQWEAVQAYEADRTFVKAAGALKIAWQNVQKRCQAAKWDVIKKAEQDMAVLLETRFVK